MNRRLLLFTCAVLALGWAPPAGAPTNQRGTPAGTVVVSGRIVDRVDGTPIPFARVEMRVGTSLGASQLGSARADERGEFRVERLTAGGYYLAVAAPGYAVAYFSSKGSTSVPPGDVLNVADNQQLMPLEIRLARGGVITGHVTNQFGVPAAGAFLNLRQTTGRGGPSPFYLQQGATSFVTDSNGDYRLYGLAEGEYLVAAQMLGSGDNLRVGSTDAPRVGHPRVFYPGTTDQAEARPVVVRPGEERSGVDIQLRLVPLLSVSGTVAVAGNANRSELQMSLRPVTGDSDGSVFVSRRNDNGFEARDVPPNRYWLTAFGHEQGRSPTERGALVWAAIEVTVTDRDLRDLTIALQPSSTLEGMLADESGNPPTQFSVTALPVSRNVDAPHPPGRPDASGKFVIRDLTPGRYRLRVGTGPNWNTEITEVEATLAGQTLTNREFEIAAGANLTGLMIRVRK